MLRAASLLGILLVAGTIIVVALAGGGQAFAGQPSTEAQYSTVGYGPVRICCKRGRHDWWASPRACWRAGGHRVAGWYCRHDAFEYRICCKRGLRDWWSTPRECRRAGGYQVANRWCRID